MADQKSGGKIREAAAENTAQLKVIADRYTYAVIRATRGIKEEKDKDVPSQWKIQAWEHLRERAEDNLARFKAGPKRLPDWVWKREYR